MNWVAIIEETPSDELLAFFAVTLGFVLALIAVVGSLVVAFVKAIRRGGSTRKARELDAQETRTIQELDRGFRTFEQRIESLETVLLERNAHTSSRIGRE